MPRTLTDDDVAEFRQRLCNAAARLFIERGPDAVTMRNLAKELGCSAMTPYRYFKDKDAILSAVRARGFDEFADALGQAAALPGDPLARNRAVTAAYVRFAMERPHVYRMMYDAPVPAENDEPVLARAGERACEQLRAPLKELIEAGMIDGDPLLIGMTLWSTLHGSVMLSLGGLLPPGPSPEAISNEVLQALVSRSKPKRAL